MRGNVWMEVRKDAMAVMVWILPEGEQEITEELLHQALADRKVRFGIDENMIAYIVRNGEYGRSYQIAAGIPPISGSDGYYEYFFEWDSREFEPKIRKDGSVDYSPSIRVVELGTKVVEYHPAKPGSFGYTVFGEKIAPPVSRELAPLQCINVEHRGNEYYATARGRISLGGNMLEVRSNLTIDGDAGYAMGTISFNGDVIVNGDVLTDVVIQAGGNITVEGVVEGALLKAGGSIVVHHGIHGRHKAVIEAGGSITSNFIEEAKVTAGTDICVDYMVNTNPSAGQTVLATGKNGLIIGGNVFAGETVDAFVIGNEAGNHTKILVDCDDARRQTETRIIVRKQLYAGAEIHVNGVRAARLPAFGEFHNVGGEVKYFDIGSYAYRAGK